jgi:hypothetical protein
MIIIRPLHCAMATTRHPHSDRPHLARIPRRALPHLRRIGRVLGIEAQRAARDRDALVARVVPAMWLVSLSISGSNTSDVLLGGAARVQRLHSQAAAVLRVRTRVEREVRAVNDDMPRAVVDVPQAPVAAWTRADNVSCGDVRLVATVHGLAGNKAQAVAGDDHRRGAFGGRGERGSEDGERGEEEGRAHVVLSGGWEWSRK